MPDLRLYRLAFAPALAALVVLAFSLQGVPEPVEPPPGTLEFDASGAAKATRDVLALGESRTPGSTADNSVADLVRERFETVVSGSVAEQEVDATVDGEDVTLRNVLLTLPGTSDDAILVIAGRDTREGEGAPGSAAATGLLLEVMNELSVTGREHTLILASTSGTSAQGEGARAIVEGLPDRTSVVASIVLSQPGLDEPFGPYVITSGGEHGPAVGMARTAEEILDTRADLNGGQTRRACSDRPLCPSRRIGRSGRTDRRRHARHRTLLSRRASSAGRAVGPRPPLIVDSRDLRSRRPWARVRSRLEPAAAREWARRLPADRRQPGSWVERGAHRARAAHPAACRVGQHPRPGSPSRQANPASPWLGARVVPARRRLRGWALRPRLCRT